jgi:transposase
MLTVTAATRIYIVAGPTDMRNSFNGLQAIVENELRRDCRKGDIFVFSNRRRDRLKLIYWEPSGFWVCSKRLEKGTFAWPQIGESHVEMTREELALLLGGIDLRSTRRRAWYGRDVATPARA